LNWGAQNWTQYSRRGLSRAEWRGRRTSLELLATLFLMHPRMTSLKKSHFANHIRHDMS